MIHYALIVRSRDGMALTASTDFSNDVDQNVKEGKRYMKLIAKKTTQFPERCTMKLESYSIHFVTSLGISYLVLCDLTYPSVLAFSFINELMKEFLSRYDTVKVNEAKRPYSFIEFDSLIHKSRQRYNRPQSLTTRVDLGDLSRELKVRPPHNVAPSDVEPPSVPNGTHRGHLNNLSVGPPRKLQPIAWYCRLALIAPILLAVLSLYRSAIALSESLEVYDGPSPLHGILFLFEGLFQLFLVSLLLRFSRFRQLEAWLIFSILLACSFFLWDVREAWLTSLYIVISGMLTLAIFRRQLKPKPPNYNV